MRSQIKLTSCCLALALCSFLLSAHAETDYYEKFVSLVDTNSTLVWFTNGVISLEKMKEGDFNGLRLGMSMSDVIKLCGKPRSFTSSCGRGPLLGFGNGYMNFKGNTLQRFSVTVTNCPNLRFTGGLTSRSTYSDFAKALKVETGGPIPKGSFPPPERSSLQWASESARFSIVWSSYDRRVESITFYTPLAFSY